MTLMLFPMDNFISRAIQFRQTFQKWRKHLKTSFKMITLLCLSSVVSAAAWAKDIATYLRAAQEFQRLVAEETQKHRMPRMTNKKVAELIATLSDSQNFLESKSYTLKDLGPLGSVCGQAHAATMSYAYFGLIRTIDAKGYPIAPAGQTLKVMEKNVVAFQEELTQLHPFFVRCMAKTIPLSHEFVLSLKPEQFTQVRRLGLSQVRKGTFQMYYGTLQMAKAKDATIKEHYVVNLLQAMAETAPHYASVLQLSARRQVFDLAEAGESTATPKLRGYFKKIAEAMNSTGCEGLCKF